MSPLSHLALVLQPPHSGTNDCFPSRNVTLVGDLIKQHHQHWQLRITN